jgi:Fe-S-cluster-containing dehydrogenase component/DMSO reductase anchor subunit
MLIDQLLIEQRELRPVDKFSRAHDQDAILTTRYRDLVPLSTPAVGGQYAFEVNLDQCSGCKACVTACHSLNGLDEGEVWRDVGQLVSDDWHRPFQQTITTACHHCVDPGCLNGCPVLAYEKDPVTGIVRHLDDQCIGCGYCVLKCPYDVPKYSDTRGIVRKCDMCSQRLAVGEAPACVQACPNEAIRITIVERESVRIEFRREAWNADSLVHAARQRWEISPRHDFTSGSLGPDSRREAESAARHKRPPRHLGGYEGEVHGEGADKAVRAPWLPSSPDPAITLPTTRFVSKKPLPHDLIPVNAGPVRLQSAHWPLVWMLVLTQLAAGAAVVALALTGAAQRAVVSIGFISCALGILASVLHLGRPLKAWRSFLGVRKSWLSREIVVFGIFLPLTASATGLLWLAPSSSLSASLLIRAAAVSGLFGVFCSAMIYHDTSRPFWIGIRSIGKFFGSITVLGLATSWLVLSASDTRATWWTCALPLAALLKLAGEHRLLRRADDGLADQAWPKSSRFEDWSLAKSAGLMRDPLGLVTRIRFFCGLMGGLFLPLLSLLLSAGTGMSSVAFVLCFAGELAERYVFFRAVVPPRMPGVL